VNTCKDCDGRGYNLSDPDGKQLKCDTCDGWGEIIDDDELYDEMIDLMIHEPETEYDEDELRDEIMARKTGK